MATEWAAKCDIACGQPYRSTPPFNNDIGQNIFMKKSEFNSSSTMDITGESASSGV